jgi:hypothetical protein
MSKDEYAPRLVDRRLLELMETELQKWHQELIAKPTSDRRKSLDRFEPKAFKKKR